MRELSSRRKFCHEIGSEGERKKQREERVRGRRHREKKEEGKRRRKRKKKREACDINDFRHAREREWG